MSGFSPGNINVNLTGSTVQVTGTLFSGTMSVREVGTPTVDVVDSITLNVSMSNTPTVNIGTVPILNVSMSNTPNVIVSSLPQVIISGTTQVSMSNTPIVNIGTAPTFAVSMSNTPIVNINGTVPISMSNSPGVSIINGAYTVNVDHDVPALVTIDAVHHQIHRGNLFHCSNTSVNGNNTNTKFWSLYTGPNEYHTSFAVYVSDLTVVSLFEGSVLSTSGTLTMVHNMDRNSASTSSCVFCVDPTMTVSGTSLVDIFVGSNAGGTRVGGSSRTNIEWILKPYTVYTVKAIPTNNATRFAINIELYETI